MKNSPAIGVVIVTYGSAPVIGECLDSLIRSEGADLRIVVCDNASPDETVVTIRDWATRSGVDLTEKSADAAHALGPVTLVHAGRNLGFAGAVNLGLRTLQQDPDVDLFWIVNPDVIVLPDSAAAFARAAVANPGFGLMGGRIVYEDPPNLIQSDGGAINHTTGICQNINQGLMQDAGQRPTGTEVDFVSGASMVASRAFLDQVGLMREDYFLYYEEVDWAMRRGDLPIVIVPDATVRHHGGTAIGTGAVGRRASAFANYFNFRNRMWFMRRFNPKGLPMAYLNSTARAVKLALEGGWKEAIGALRGLNGLAPPREVAERVSPDARALAFGRMQREEGRP